MTSIGLSSREASLSLLEAIVDSSVDAIISETLDGAITSWNLGAERMYGYSAAEAIGRPISMLCPPHRLDELAEALRRIANGGLVEQHDTRRVRKDGTELDVSITIAPIHSETGEIVGASAIGRDITRRLELENERRALDVRLNQSERLGSLGRLAGGIAHDFNNLLSVIMNYSSFVDEELDNHDQAHADITQIQAATVRASGLVRQLLAFARREVLKPQVLNVNKVINDLESLLSHTLSEQVVLSFSLAEDLWMIEADSGQLEQVLVNLVVNARDAMPKGGLVTIQTDNLEIDAGYAATLPGISAGNYVQLRVSDNGCGIDKSSLEHVFEPFFTTKPHGEGTGLGLPMIFGIITQAGGDIQIYSEVGVGTTCRVLLPATERQLAPTERGEGEGTLAGTESILVVEDEEALREVTRRILCRNGYAVTTAADGVEALALFSERPDEFALVVSDVIMPRMVGKELARIIHILRSDTKVLFMSGYSQPVLGSTLSDNSELLEKPFSERELLQRIRSVLDGTACVATDAESGHAVARRAVS